MSISEWLQVLCDPESKTSLTYENNILKNKDGKQYSIIDGKPDFLAKAEEIKFASQRDSLDRLKTIFKNLLGKHYTKLIYIISPVYPRMHWRSLTTYFTYACKE